MFKIELDDYGKLTNSVIIREIDRDDFEKTSYITGVRDQIDDDDMIHTLYFRVL